MGKRCVVGGCSNTTADNVAIHNWPGDKFLAGKWNAFIKTTRSDWLGNHKAPAICSDHFSKPESYINWGQYEGGFAKKPILHSSAVPTHQKSGVVEQKRSKAVDKLGASRRLNELSVSPQNLQKERKDGSTRSDESGDGIESERQVNDSDEEYSPPSKKRKPAEPAKWDDEQAQYVVSQSQLLTLFQFCGQCAEPSPGEVIKRSGLMIVIQQTCPNCGHVREWKSQPEVCQLPLANLMLTAAALFSGIGFAKITKFLTFMKIPSICKSTYYRHQRKYVFPAVFNMWDEEIRAMELPKKLDLAGDCRSDSPGFCAKYGVYTVIEQNIQKVIGMEVVQKNEAGSSNACELVGLQRTFDKFGAENISSLVTDRHRGITKYLREKQPQVKHRFDLWHVAKSVVKKVSGAAKKNESLNLWAKGIKNHLYYSVLSTDDDNGELKACKWECMLNHVQNIHEHDNDLYPQCPHGDIEREWLKEDDDAFKKLKAIVLDNTLMKDIKMVSSKGQTSSLEAFHSLIIQYCPKSHVYGNIGMKCRMIIAALHFNENANRQQATTSDGTKRYTMTYSKRAGNFVVKKIKTKTTYEFGHRMMSNLLHCYKNNRELLNTIQAREEAIVPPPVCSQYKRPDKKQAVAAYEAIRN